MIVFIITNNSFAQSGHNNIGKQPPKINGIPKAISNANVNAKIHANSNSVVGAGNSQSNYNKTEPPKKEAIREEGEIKKSNVKKQKK